MKQKKFLFVGNGSYANRGCEAIVRGSMEILKNSLKDPVFAMNAVSEQRSIVVEQESVRAVPGVESQGLLPVRGLDRMLLRAAKLLDGEPPISKAQLKLLGSDCVAALAVGGDNFSLEYGRPYAFLGWNRVCSDLGLPVIIWGASIGPFTRDPGFEQMFVKSARRVDWIFVRETESFKYLRGLGLEKKIELVADPAFVMQPEAPSSATLDCTGMLGLNLSPLLGGFLSGGESWLRVATETVELLAKSLEQKIVLISHVNATELSRSIDDGYFAKDDLGFHSSIYEGLSAAAKSRVKILSGELNAPQLKFCISQLAAFAGARTHATIAAFSTEVPCLSFSYSVKAKGLNKDIFGGLDWCIDPSNFDPSYVLRKIKELIAESESIKSLYKSKIPAMKELAYKSGRLLADKLNLE